ncbi:DUF397 domain-containing protein [Streptomyces sp. CB01249]|nr:DUF397 domain-containing protein [Streptomyces sp. CB01249]
MNDAEPARHVWFKSNYNSNEGGECVEVACSGVTREMAPTMAWV